MANIYLSKHELDETLDIYFKYITNKIQEVELIDTDKACGRITAKAIYAKISSPHFNASAMDGVATLSSKTFNANDKNPVVLELDKDYIVVDTGDPIPKRFDSVIMIEDITQIDEQHVMIYKSIAPWQNIRLIGEDIIKEQLIMSSGHEIRPVDIGALLAGGINQVSVYKKPVVGIIPTGTELVEPGTVLKEGELIDFNTKVFASQVEEWGAVSKRYPIVEDDYDKIKEVVAKANKECDIVIISAGSSAGREDFTSQVVDELGSVIIHGVAIRPGKPVILGIIGEKPVIGVPGYPVSAYFIMQKIVRHIVAQYCHKKVKTLDKVKAVLSTRIVSSLKYHEFIRVKLGCIGNKLIATPLSRGAGVTMSLVNADAILEVPIEVEGIEEDTEVYVELLKDIKEIENTLVCVGSQDPIIDIIQDMFKVKQIPCDISVAHVGSMGGIMSLIKGTTHIAPIHLLDTDTGEYNVSYVKRYIKNKGISIIKFLDRMQGLLVPKGNPLNIREFKDLKRKEIRFINRQRGSGTRVLLDYNLNQLHINSELINGYEREEMTHLGVAIAVKSGNADCGLGVYSAAKIMDLDFIPICCEEYDLVVRTEDLLDERIKAFIELIKGEEFKKRLDFVGGYGYARIGTIIKIGKDN